MIEHGYKLPFYSTSGNYIGKNNSALANAEFVQKSIADLVCIGCVKLVALPKVVRPLTVSVNSSGKQRLILDPRNVNQHLYKFPVKYEALDVLKTFVRPNGFMVKFDLRSGYHHLDVFEEHQTYLGFAWNSGTVTKYYVFTVYITVRFVIGLQCLYQTPKAFTRSLES